MPCFYCGVRLRKNGHRMKTRDHVIPKSKGGTHTVDACLSCNSRKKDMSLEEFRAMCGGIEFWYEMRLRLANTETAWLVEDLDVPEPHAETEKSIPQDTKEFALPSSLPYLAGTTFGLFTVVKYLGRITKSKSARPVWLVRCRCGATEHRSTRAIRNESNTFDACTECRKPVEKLRTDIYRETGQRVFLEECFQHIYGTLLKNENPETANEMYSEDREDHTVSQEFECRHSVSIESLLADILHELRAIRRELYHPTPTSIKFTQELQTMALLPADAGNTLVFTGKLTPTGSEFPTGTTFTVTSSDPTVLPTVDATGLIVTIPIPATATVGETLTVTYTTSTFVPEPSTSPATVLATITLTIGAQPVITLTPTGITFVQTT